MATLDHLRVGDVYEAYRLIGECRDLGGEPSLWQAHMSDGLSRLLGAPASGGVGRLTPAGGILPLTHHASGLDAADGAMYLTYMREGGASTDPFVLACQSAPRTALTRSQTIPDRVYCRSPFFDRYLRPGRVYHRLASMFPTAVPGVVTFLHVHRGRGERDFRARDRARLEFLHREIGPLVGRALVSEAEPRPGDLPRRLRQTFACLVEGDTEKQVAARLGLNTATAHQYVTALYRRFGVNSRGQLLAHVVKRIARPEWRDGLGGGPTIRRSEGADDGTEPTGRLEAPSSQSGKG